MRTSHPSMQMTWVLVHHYQANGTLNPFGFTFLLMTDINILFSYKFNSVSFFLFFSSFCGDPKILKLTVFRDADLKKKKTYWILNYIKI